jgi:hypothetical protein
VTAEGEIIEHTITLNLRLLRSMGWTPPDRWNWTDLLDLAGDETCEVVYINSRLVDPS